MTADVRASDATGSRRARPHRLTAPMALAGALLTAAGALVAYLRRGTGDSVSRMGARNAETIVTVQRAVGLDVERSIQLSFLGRGVVGELLMVVYGLGYWPSILAAVLVTAVRDRSVLARFVWAIAVSGLTGLLVLTAFPVAPPRLVGTLDDQVARSSLAVIAHPSGWFNPYAAMPSFHVCWTVLAALATRRVVGASVAVVPALMSLAVVTTGNHWVLDVFAGWALAGLAWWLAPSLHRRARAGLDRHRRR